MTVRRMWATRNSKASHCSWTGMHHGSPNTPLGPYGLGLIRVASAQCVGCHAELVSCLSCTGQLPSFGPTQYSAGRQAGWLAGRHWCIPLNNCPPSSFLATQPAAAGFLSRFEGASCPAKLLEEITIIDTPGVLSGEKQRIERNYNV